MKATYKTSWCDRWDFPIAFSPWQRSRIITNSHLAMLSFIAVSRRATRIVRDLDPDRDATFPFRLITLHREAQSDHRAAVRSGLDLDATAMDFGNAPGDSEAKSATRASTAISTPEALENLLAFFNRDTRSVIAHGNDRARTRRDLNARSCGRMRHRVFDQIPDRTAYGLAMAGDYGCIVVHEPDASAFANRKRCQLACNISADRAKIGRRTFRYKQCISGRHVEHLPHHPRHARDVFKQLLPS